MKLEIIQSASAVGRRFFSRTSIWRIKALISRRARCAPRQKWGEFFDGRIEQAGRVGGQCGVLRRVVEQRVESAGNEVASGVTSGVDEEQEPEEEVDLVDSMRAAFVVEQFTEGEQRSQVILRVGSLGREDLLAVGVHFAVGGPLGVDAHHIGRRVEHLGVVIEPPAVLEGDAEHLGDDETRHLAGEISDQVARAPFDDLVDNERRKLVDPMGQRAGSARCEAPADHAPHTRVHRRVGHQHHHMIGVPSFVVGISDHDRRLRREGLSISADGLDIVIAGQDPITRTAVRLGVAVDGVVLPEPIEGLVRLTAGKAAMVVEVDGGGSVGDVGHFVTPWAAPDRSHRQP